MKQLCLKMLPMRHLFTLILLVLTSFSFAQGRFPSSQLSINGFRNPSVGIEYQRNKLSLHAGYYLTNFEKNVTTEFIKIGITEWFLPFGNNEMPSSFYSGVSYLRGLTREYKATNSLGLETGVRWYVWKGLNFRLGVIALVSKDKEAKINPTPSVSYTLKLGSRKKKTNSKFLRSQ